MNCFLSLFTSCLVDCIDNRTYLNINHHTHHHHIIYYTSFSSSFLILFVEGIPSNTIKYYVLTGYAPYRPLTPISSCFSFWICFHSLCLINNKLQDSSCLIFELSLLEELLSPAIEQDFNVDCSDIWPSLSSLFYYYHHVNDTTLITYYSYFPFQSWKDLRELVYTYFPKYCLNSNSIVIAKVQIAFL